MLAVGAGVVTLTLPISEVRAIRKTSDSSCLTAALSSTKGQGIALAEGKISQELYEEMKIKYGSGELGYPKKLQKNDHLIREKKELTEEQKAEIQIQHKEKLAQEVAEGKITQKQYRKMLKNLERFTFPMMQKK
ncbi:hypothetical protein J5893_02925 [bacterium]|nr:hypothetical protein [bacterium]